MLRVFQDDLAEKDRFVITLELVPGKESTGRSVDTVMGIARDAFADGRVSAVSITDNPGGNPALSPDVLGYQIFKVGMDVIVHFTCRDLNRVGMESRALQLAMMGMKNILALTGDYTGKGFGGQGAPVFDLDSVNLLIMLGMISDRMHRSGDPDGFFTGCAVSPFKRSEAECFAQYAKLCRKTAAGARFVITQLGYDAAKFQELTAVMHLMERRPPVLGSVYLLNARAAAVMNRGKVPGAVVTDALLSRVQAEWRDPRKGRAAAVERAAQLGAVLKGLGYKGMHLGGIHKDFTTAGTVLDRMEAIEDRWQDFLPEFSFPQPDGFYAFRGDRDAAAPPRFGRSAHRLSLSERIHFKLMRKSHHLFFEPASRLHPLWIRISRELDRRSGGRTFARWLEYIFKGPLLGCRQCGDCGIEHVAFLCPESQCPKHTRNGSCGGSLDGRCEVYPDKHCIWYRAYGRLASIDRTHDIVNGCIPPRMWELDRTSSWLNFHLGRDHQSAATEIVRRCHARSCRLKPDAPQRESNESH